MNFEQEYKRWTEKVTDPELRSELDRLAADDEKRELYFTAPLEFGTAGLRGVMTAGIGAMNVYTVAQATQGFADYIRQAAPDNMKIVIGYDCRIHSLDFARTAASVMAENGVKVFLFDELRPTPVLSFAVRHLGCAAGINITASHNPKQYNGYKAYWSDGAQIGPEQAEAIEASIKAADIFDGVKRGDFDRLLGSGMIEYVGAEVDEAYLAEVLKQRVDPDAIPAVAEELKIVYTPLHGTGYRLIPECLKRAGLKHLIKVEPQFVIDGSFPTVDFPNPEYPAVFEIGIGLADESGSDLIIATDPDADRTGIMARNKEGRFVTLTGNQVGALLLEYIATAMEAKGPMPEDAYAIKTIVSTELVSAICKAHKITLHNVLTGFKYIGEVIGRYEAEGRGHYLLGFEESYGYLRGSYARDKDAVVATLLLTELAAKLKAEGKTLCDAMDDIYARYGCYREGVDNIYMEGLDGPERMAKLMEILRSDPPKEISGSPVRYIRDYVKQTITDLKTGDVQPTNLPVSNVLYFETEADDVTVIRPSGTEPKIKLYYLMHADTFEENDRMIAEAKALFKGYVSKV
ncbi:MAG: phospho-sugar mutase [Clostridiales bacterium]|nr:phospho-sugar mutase [Clostridiales bacterium]